MTEPTDRHREIATKIAVRAGRGADGQYVRYVAAWLATVCAEERERSAEIAESAFDRDPVDPSDAEADATWIAAKIRSGE